MKKLLLALALFLPAVAFAQSGQNVTLNCVAPTMYAPYTDSAGVAHPASPIPASDVLKFNFYGGLVEEPLVLLSGMPVPTCSSVRVNVKFGSLVYAATALSTANGTESVQSMTVTATIVPVSPPLVPQPPSTPTATLSTVTTIAYVPVLGNNRLTFLIVGTLPIGTPCDLSQRDGPFYVVDRAAVTFTGAAKPTTVVAACGPAS